MNEVVHTAQSVAVILPTYNRKELLCRAIDSVLSQTLKPKHFYILNNHSSDGTFEYLENLVKTYDKSLLPQLHVFHHSTNLGASGGMRYLFDASLRDVQTQWIWVMDDDGYAEKAALEELLNAQEAKDSNTYILESAIHDTDGIWSAANRPARFCSKDFSFHAVSEQVFQEAYGKAQGILVNTGGYCGMLMHRKAFEEFGFPRTEFYLWYDDVDFVLRVSQKKNVFLIPRAKVRHDAQALVLHVKQWPFRGPLPKVPAELMWRYYYLNRNWLWMAKQWLPPIRYSRFWIKHMARNLAVPILLRQDHLLWRLKLATYAGFDALFNRLGSRIL